MTIDMILNEHSLTPLADNIYTARERMHTLQRTMSSATKVGVNKTLRTDRYFLTIDLAPAYPMQKWANDREVNRDLQRYIKSFLTKTPYLAEHPKAENLAAKQAVSEANYNNQPANGLHIAYISEGLALSFNSDPCWNTSQLTIDYTWIDPETADLDTWEAQVIHASQPDHIAEHITHIEQLVRANLQDGTELIEQRANLYPHLQFCETAIAQIKDLTANDPHWPVLLRMLGDLEAYAATWSSGPFDKNNLRGKLSPESESTERMYGAERTFVCPDGEHRFFTWHLKNGPKRLHFYPLEAERSIIIGYFGKHLSTKLYH